MSVTIRKTESGIVIKAPRGWVFDVSRESEIREIFLSSSTEKVSVTKREIMYKTNAPNGGLSQTGWDYLLKPFMLISTIVYARGYSFINKGKGITDSELEEFLAESEEKQTGLDDLLSDSAIVPIIIRELLAELKKE